MAQEIILEGLAQDWKGREEKLIITDIERIMTRLKFN